MYQKSTLKPSQRVVSGGKELRLEAASRTLWQFLWNIGQKILELFVFQVIEIWFTVVIKKEGHNKMSTWTLFVKK